MYPEEIYTLSLPLPYELLRPISFQVACNLIKEKLKFPKYGEGFLGAFLRIVYTDEKNVFFHWYECATGEFTTQLIHRVYTGDDYAVHERKYYSVLSNKGYKSHVILTLPTVMMLRFFTQ